MSPCCSETMSDSLKDWRDREDPTEEEMAGGGGRRSTLSSDGYEGKNMRLSPVNEV